MGVQQSRRHLRSIYIHPFNMPATGIALRFLEPASHTLYPAEFRGQLAMEPDGINYHFSFNANAAHDTLALSYGEAHQKYILHYLEGKQLIYLEEDNESPSNSSFLLITDHSLIAHAISVFYTLLIRTNQIRNWGQFHYSGPVHVHTESASYNLVYTPKTQLALPNNGNAEFCTHQRFLHTGEHYTDMLKLAMASELAANLYDAVNTRLDLEVAKDTGGSTDELERELTQAVKQLKRNITDETCSDGTRVEGSGFGFHISWGINDTGLQNILSFLDLVSDKTRHLQDCVTVSGGTYFRVFAIPYAMLINVSDESIEHRIGI